jgi:hypothetical protein
MYPTRLRVTTGEYYQLYAYPKPRPQDSIVQLKTQILAVVTYVLGSTWREDLHGRQMLPVPQVDWTEDDEHDIALRLLRSGGAIMDNGYSNGQWWIFDDGFGSRWLPAEQQKKYIFGWPDSGGVWVLLLPPLLEKHIDGTDNLQDELEQMNDWDNIAHTVFRDTDGSVHYGDLIKSATMEDLCNGLKDLGAVFYEEVKDSPEVLESGRMDTATAIRKTPI